MKHKVLFTPAARAQFLAALAYIRVDNPDAAATLRRRAEAALSRLRDYPESGHVLPEFPELPFREVVVSPYRFFYRVKGDAVWMVAVWHSAQPPDEPHEGARV
ncbi:MAG TPA: type II toxin-antitoxin system RelE/ParE family toxin [Thermoleophilia bacterium]|nr:type II toxin-antitoxin system RelE/ParE family toxin [Thermoleophilia bacterium]